MEPTIEHSAPVDRPRSFGRGVQFLFSAVVIGLLNAIYTLAQRVAGLSMVFALLIVVVFFGLFFFLVMKISARRNWARIVWLVFVIFNVAFAVLAYPQAVRANVISGTLSIIIVLLQVIGTILLFTGSANAWFRKAK